MSPFTPTPALILINAPYGNLEIRGRSSPPAGVMNGIDIAGTGVLAISSGRRPITTASFTDVYGEEQDWDPNTQRGPVLYEDTTYHLYIVGAAFPPKVHHRDPLFARNLSRHPEQRVCAGTFNFGRQVGRTEVEVRFGPEVLRFVVEVVPTKIDYTSDYQQLQSDIEASFHGLALAYMRTTHQRADSGQQPSTEIEWLTILRQEAIRLQQAMEQINRNPHRQMTRERREQATHKLKRPDAVARRAIIRGKGSGGFDYVANLGQIRQTIPSIAAHSTLDTAEHRWLALHLSEIRRHLRTISVTLAAEAASGRSREVSLRRRSEGVEVHELLRRVNQMLDTKCIQAASRLPQLSPPSLTLLSAVGYRESHQILTNLQLALNLQGDALDLQTKDIHDLYEIWSFLKILQVLAAVTAAEIDPTPLIYYYRNGLRIRLRVGAQSDVDLTAGSRLLTVSYNRTYPGQTGDQRPDIVIRIQEHTKPDLIIVLDAKYRVDATTEFRKSHGAAGPPIDAINTLHRYRDAITIGADTHKARRPVIRGAALFPLTTEETEAYTNGRLYQSLESLGIGALPFLPGNTRLVREWLTQLLSLPSSELAWNGPPGPTSVANTRRVC